jgi:DNA invertase Pin-like site-specific DNA recombinase
MAPRTVDGYIRVSRVGDRGDRLMSPELQEDAIQAEAKRLSYRMGELFRDIDRSGGRDDRPGLLTAIERIEAKQSRGIVVTRLDRFSRDTLQALQLARRIEDAGGQLYVVEEPADFKTADGALSVELRLVIATHQRRTANAYFEKSKAQAIANGVPIMPVSALPPGYLRDPDTRRLVVDVEVAPVVREVFQRRAGGAGPAELGRLLESHGIPTAVGGQRWSKTTVYRLLSNRVYLGELSYGDRYLNPRAHEPIIDEATFAAAQGQGRRPSATRSHQPSPLAGLVRCGSCRYTVKAPWESRHGRIYRCGRIHAAGECPDPVYISGSRAEELERIVEREFFRMAVDRYATAHDQTLAEKIASLEAEREKAERALDLYRDDPDLEATIADLGGRERWREGLRVRQERIAELDAQLAELHTSDLEAIPPKRLTEEWESMSAQDRRALFATLIDCVVLRPATRGDDLAERVWLLPSGTAPADLPRRGKLADGIRPFDAPPAAVGSL